MMKFLIFKYGIILYWYSLVRMIRNDINKYIYFDEVVWLYENTGENTRWARNINLSINS